VCVATVDPGIFKAYDVRGIYGDELDAGGAELIGRAFARVIGQMEGKTPAELALGLGHDMRLSAPAMAAAYARGMSAEGAHVLDAGMVGTEMLYHLVGTRDLDGGIMCTASHNPKAYTGAKLIRRGALALSGDEGIGDVREIVAGFLSAGEGAGDGAAPRISPGGPTLAATSAAKVTPRAPGTIEQVSIYDSFQEEVSRFIDADAIRPLKVVVDGGNGMAGPMVGPLLERLGLQLEEAYWQPNGEFPDHEPNPLLPENREFIMAEVVRRQADLGIAWDGDADRCFFIDDTGQFVDGDFMTALLSESLLRKNPGATILYDVRASRAVPDVVQAGGGTALINRVGHAFFKQRMRERSAVFGGEVSGHYYFREFHCADSGTIPALLVLEELSGSGKSMSELLVRFRSKYFISGEINSKVADAPAKLRQIADRYADARQSFLDGISIDYDDWHFNVRASNTEPLLRLCLESLRSREDMEMRRDEVLGLIRG
jgi:phosphomannomutase